MRPTVGCLKHLEWLGKTQQQICLVCPALEAVGRMSRIDSLLRFNMQSLRELAVSNWIVWLFCASYVYSNTWCVGRVEVMMVNKLLKQKWHRVAKYTLPLHWWKRNQRCGTSRYSASANRNRKGKLWCQIESELLFLGNIYLSTFTSLLRD